MSKLDGKVAVITGGTTGIGLATAKLFVAEGAYVFITGRRQKELDEAVKGIGNNVTGIRGDVASLADLDRLYDAVRAKGRIDIVFANAGIGEFVLLEKLTEEQFDKVFNINVKGLLFTVQKALPLLNDGGSIILTGSIAGIKGTPAFGVYGASKAAVRSLVRGWTMELKDRRIRSNVISPGPIDTPIFAPQPKEAIDRLVATIPMGRLGQPEEVAKAVLFLASDDFELHHGYGIVYRRRKSPGLALIRAATMPTCTQNIVFVLLAVFGTGCRTSQCSTTFPSVSKRKISTPAVSLLPNLSTAHG